MVFMYVKSQGANKRRKRQMVRVIDWQGNERDEAYLKAKYGNYKIKEAAVGPGCVYKITTLVERADGDFVAEDLKNFPESELPDAWTKADTTLITRIEDANGNAVSGVRVAFYWNEAPVDGDAGPLGGVLPEMVPNRCVSGLTENGNVGNGMGKGAYYWPAQGQIGPHATWVHGGNTRSDVILGLGMVAGTNHYHFNVHYTRYDEDPPIEPPEPPQPPEPPVVDNWEQLFQKLDVIIETLQALE